MTGKYVLALEEARRGLDRQSQDLTSLRNRATALLGTGGTLASVLGGLAIRDGAELRLFSYVAIGAFCGLAAVSVIVLWPRKIAGSHDPDALIKAAEVEDATLDDVTAHLARQIGEQYDHNAKVLDCLVFLYCVEAVLFAVQAISLLVDLRGR